MVYVSQSIGGCESVKAILPVSVKQYKKEESFIMNIITPNGDDRNEAFFITTENFENCLGDFRGVTIYNRFGNTIFRSDKANFAWLGDDVPAGVYFYSIVFGMDKFHGTITVQK